MRHRDSIPPSHWPGALLLAGSASLSALAQAPTINKYSDIQLGAIVPGASSGTVILYCPGGGRGSSGGTSLGPSGGTLLGSLTLTGPAGDAWSLSAGSAVPFDLAGPGGILHVTNLVIEPSSGTFPASGPTGFCYLGATISVGASGTVPQGTYIGSFSLTATNTTHGQSSTQSFSVITQVDPVITLTQLTGLSFGDIYSAPTAGTVLLSPAGARSSTGGVSLGNQSPFGAATFAVTGSANATYSITLPTSATLTGPVSTLTVSTFTSSPSGTGTLNGVGQQQLNIGATLNLEAHQGSGSYSGTFAVTVAYN